VGRDRAEHKFLKIALEDQLRSAKKREQEYNLSLKNLEVVSLKKSLGTMHSRCAALRAERDDSKHQLRKAKSQHSLEIGKLHVHYFHKLQVRHKLCWDHKEGLKEVKEELTEAQRKNQMLSRKLAPKAPAGMSNPLVCPTGNQIHRQTPLLAPPSV
jgi:hypothetical protein